MHSAQLADAETLYFYCDKSQNRSVSVVTGNIEAARNSTENPIHSGMRLRFP